MKSDRAVLDASPLIVLFKANLAHLLPQVFTDVLVPDAVWDEVGAGGSSDVAAQQLATVDWAKRVEVATIATAVLPWNLGQGESQVLSAALSHAGCRVVVDDAAARAVPTRFKCRRSEPGAFLCWQNGEA